MFLIDVVVQISRNVSFFSSILISSDIVFLGSVLRIDLLFFLEAILDFRKIKFFI